jgi:outer membrane protein assembly factor BamB
MTEASTEQARPRKPLRLWPGVAAALLICIGTYIVPLFSPEAVGIGMIAALAGTLIFIVWWLFFSRAPWLERLGALALIAIALFGTSRFVHRSISNGMMGMLFPIYAVPAMAVVFVAWAVATRRRSDEVRRITMVATILIASGFWALVRTGGMTANGSSDFHWRWTPTPEDRLVAQSQNESIKPTVAPASAAEKPAEWPGFRGPDRDGIVHGVRIETDWAKTPPVQMWRRAVGPAWSSFAVRGDLFYTQEQRGEEEIVACYRIGTGEPVWTHSDATRFWESNAGAGPRGTPTLSSGRVYTFGGTGILNALDATTGSVIWSRNVASGSDVKVPMWGFSSSPLVFGDVVIIAASGKLAAYDAATGTPRWTGPAHGGSYSSPHLVTLGGIPQVVLLSGAGATSVAPTNGAVLWDYSWPGSTIVQPGITADGDMLISTGGATGGLGVRRLAVSQGPDGWKVSEKWTSPGLKPYFNDSVVHKGHAYGFDGSILACIELQDGKRKWKGGHYGNGQLVLLADQDLLLVVSETGELALVSATPDEFKEIARFPGIEGKTWNHPVLVSDVLLVRNSEQMAAFRLAAASK